MTSDRLFERDLPEMLAQLGSAPAPDYRDDIVQRTATMRQRPAWSFPTRRLPMPAITGGLPRVPVRVAAVVALGLLLLAILAVLAIGARPNLPAPFGPARNGLVAFARDGDISVADPRTGKERAVVAGPETDIRPIFSRDGTRLAFERKTPNDLRSGRIYVVAIDGSALTEVTREPLSMTKSYVFSPNGREVLIWTGTETEGRIHIAMSDGSGIRTIQIPVQPWNPVWRPPDGNEILITGTTRSGVGGVDFDGLYAITAEGGAIRTILEPLPGRFRGDAIWSSDGSRISYVEWIGTGMTARTHIISADGSGDRLLTEDPAARWEALRAWSNDGTRMLVVRGYSSGMEDVHAAIVPVDGDSLGIEVDYPGTIQAECCSSWEWAPDDSVILGTPTDQVGQALSQVMIDPLTGRSWPVPWSANSYPTWQRLAH